MGDLDTQVEIASTSIAITVAPINDIPYLANSQSYVAENKLNSDFDDETDVAIGRAMGMTVDDKDGSQYLDVVISGFPVNVIRLYFAEELGSVAASVDKERGTVTLGGENSTEVLAVLETLVVVLANDDDRNFKLTIEGTSKDSNGVIEVVDTYSLFHTVVVGAVADTPTLDAGSEIKQLAVEGSSGNMYRVNIGLNDRDGKPKPGHFVEDNVLGSDNLPLSPLLSFVGSETYKGNSVDIDVSFPSDIANGAPPKVEFIKKGSVTVTTTGPPVRKSLKEFGLTDILRRDWLLMSCIFVERMLNTSH